MGLVWADSYLGTGAWVVSGGIDMARVARPGPFCGIPDKRQALAVMTASRAYSKTEHGTFDCSSP